MSGMGKFASERAREFYARTYDVSVSDWPGEIDFYRALAAEVRSKGGKVLELGCGTGRVAIRLARGGVEVVGLDLSGAMLAVAREKSAGIGNLRWVEGDMRAFELGEIFHLAIVPGHGFQNLLTAEDQRACLESVRRHLAPGGLMVVHLDHQSVDWLGDLWRDGGGAFEAGEQFLYPGTERQIRALRAWSYERAAQTAVLETVWEEVGPDGRVVDRWETGPVRLHCVFRFEMEHLLGRTRFAVEAVYGDFFKGELGEDSPEMIWVARKAVSGTPGETAV
jgi:SAM-dependent methyltransferase